MKTITFDGRFIEAVVDEQRDYYLELFRDGVFKGFHDFWEYVDETLREHGNFDVVLTSLALAECWYVPPEKMKELYEELKEEAKMV